MSAEEVCAQVQEQFPHVNISTVYRTLELLVGLDLVQETRLGPAGASSRWKRRCRIITWCATPAAA